MSFQNAASMSPSDAWDVVIVGAGAAGLMAAYRCGARGLRTLCLEKNRKPGVKILISGGTRCNLTHDCDRRGIVEAFGSAGPFLHSALAVLGPRETTAFFNDAGLPTYVEPDTGKVFPSSDRALDVVNTLLGLVRSGGAELAVDEPVTTIERADAGDFRIVTTRRELRAKKLLLTTGGRSYPGCGTTGDGYRWLAALGHTIRPPRPALVPLTSAAAWVRELSGIVLPDVLLSVVAADGGAVPPSVGRRKSGLPANVLIRRRGALLFTHFGVSGLAVLDVSRAVTGASTPQSVRLEADLFPDVAESDLDESLRRAALGEPKKLAPNLVPDVVVRRVVDAVFVQADVPVDRRAAEFGNDERRRLAAALKGLRIPVSGSRGFEKAEVTAGGVSLDEVDSRTMQSKIVPNLYLAGEVLDLDGFIGGYNFQAAFSTAWLAADSL